MTGSPLERLQSGGEPLILAPAAILLYCAALAALRLSFSPFLEVDEAQFVGQVDWRLVYANSHPPLYNWLVRIALEATGWSWALALATVKYALLAGYHVMVWAAARRLGGPSAGLLALAAAAFLPQVVWMSVHTLAHSVMVLTASAALAFTVIRAAHRGGIADFALVGAAAAVGALAKFNFFLFMLPLAVVLAADPVLRPRLFGRNGAIALGVFLALTAPSLIAALVNFADSTERLEKMARGGGRFEAIDLPFLGVDGFVEFILATIAWIGPAAAIWALALAADRELARRGGGPSRAEHARRAWENAAKGSIDGVIDAALRRALGRAMLLGLALFAVGVLLGDARKVPERYLTPVLAAAPIWLAVAWPLDRTRSVVLGVAAAAFLAAGAGFTAMTIYGKHRYAIPYESVAAAIRRTAPEPLPIRARRHDDAANLVLALRWPGAAEPTFQPLGDNALMLWRGRREYAPEILVPDGFGAADAIVTIRAPYRNRSGAEIVYQFQRFERLVSDPSRTSPGSE